MGRMGPVYPGTCRHLGAAERTARASPPARPTRCGSKWTKRWPRRARSPSPIASAGRIAVDGTPFGDVVLARKDVPTSYHLAVVVDDAAQGVTLVTRGEDLLPATHVHRILQALLGLPEPGYAHHRAARATRRAGASRSATAARRSRRCAGRAFARGRLPDGGDCGAGRVSRACANAGRCAGASARWRRAAGRRSRRRSRRAIPTAFHAGISSSGTITLSQMGA